MPRLINKSTWNTVQPVLQYFRRDAYNYWRPHLEVEQATGSQPLAYYLDFEPKADHPGPFDAAGISLTDYGPAAGIQYYPINIAQFGLGHLARYRRTGSDVSRATFLDVAHWLLRALRPVPGGGSMWLTDFDWLDVKAPWPSGMAQGQGISVLVRAHLLEPHRPEFLHGARSAAAALTTSIEHGGVGRETGSGGLFFEECPSQRVIGVLNGHIFCLWGLADLRSYDPLAAELWSAGVVGLEETLSEFDLGYWSAYDRSTKCMRNPASAFYHELHIRQLVVMEKLTGIAAFGRYAARWQAYSDSWRSRLRAVGAKSVHKVLYY